VVAESLAPGASVVHKTIVDAGASGGIGGSVPCPDPGKPSVPFKLNQDRRHHIPRQTRKVTNWPAYEAGLRQRGSLTVWFSDEAIAAWAAEPRASCARIRTSVAPPR